DLAPLEEAVRKLHEYDMVAFTSQNAAFAVFDALEREGADARRFGNARICAVGPKTAEALRARGIRPDLLPAQYKGESLAEEVLAALPKTERARVLLPRSA